MFKILPIDVRVCKLMRYYFGTASELCEYSSGWRYRSRGKWSQISSTVFGCGQCPLALFPYAYWAVFAISLCGTFFALAELMNICGCCRKPLTIWRERRLYVLSYRIMRRFRIAGSATMVTAWVMLVIGLLDIRPRAMLPWLCITTTVLTVDFFLWCNDVFFGRLVLSYNTLLTFGRSIAMLYLVCSVKSALDKAVATKRADALRLF